MPKRDQRPYTAYSEIVIDVDGPTLEIDGKRIEADNQSDWRWTVRIYPYDGGKPELHEGTLPKSANKAEVRAAAIAKRDAELAKYAVKEAS